MLVKAGWIAALSVGMFGKWAFLSDSPFAHPRAWSERDTSIFWMLAVGFLIGIAIICWAL
jgi:hypothetical protein